MEDDTKTERRARPSSFPFPVQYWHVIERLQRHARWHELSGTAMRVLLCLVKHTNAEKPRGSAYPSCSTIAKETRNDLSSVKRALADLREAGCIEHAGYKKSKHPRRRGVVRWSVILPFPDLLDDSTGGDSATSTGGDSATGTSGDSATGTSGNHAPSTGGDSATENDPQRTKHREPSTKNKKRARDTDSRSLRFARERDAGAQRAREGVSLVGLQDEEDDEKPDRFMIDPETGRFRRIKSGEDPDAPRAVRAPRRIRPVPARRRTPRTLRPRSAADRERDSNYVADLSAALAEREARLAAAT